MDSEQQIQTVADTQGLTAYPDIEVYIKGKNAEDILAWLTSQVGTLQSDPTRAGRTVIGSVLANRVPHSSEATDTLITPEASAGKELPVFIVENAADGFTSVCFETADTPWKSDLECAEECYRYFAVEIRCSASGWQQQDQHAHQQEQRNDWWSVQGATPERIRWEG